MLIQIASILTVALLPAIACASENIGPNPVELGNVRWSRSLEAALTASQASGKPVIVLFQEIPGCKGCQDFGNGPLSHPLLVEAIEDLFVPVAINNRGGGADDAVLARYNEPKLNYPVARFVDANGTDLIPRRDEIFTISGVADRMIASLKTANRPVPDYLRIVADEHRVDRQQTATFAMHCYWEGEAKLGGLPGVVNTQAAWQDSHEVVDVTFDPSVIGYADLLREARSRDCASLVYAHDAEQATIARMVVQSDVVRDAKARRIAKASDQKYALKQTALQYLPLTPSQTTRVNAMIAAGRSPDSLLSPRQMSLKKKILAAIAIDPSGLDGLAPPTSLDDWTPYVERLSDRIDAIGAHAGA